MRPAFTLIEQLAAVALASLLMTAAWIVLSDVTRPRAEASVKSAGNPKSEVFELIRWDLANASRMRIMPGRMVLAGFGSMDPVTHAPTQRPARVTYAIESGRLLREQVSVDVLSNRNRWSEYVSDVTGMDLAPLGRPAPATTRPTRDEIFGPSDGQPVPEAIRVTLTLAPDGRRMEKVLCLR